MEIVPIGISASFEVTLSAPDLPAMLNWVDNSYRGKFTPPVAKSYLILKAVYMDDSFEVIDNDFPQGSESILATQVGGGGSQATPVGYVDNNVEIVGYVGPQEVLEGNINC